jgi:NTP pyrophosphatase (non-canonical NTP hydrolase)
MSANLDAVRYGVDHTVGVCHRRAHEAGWWQFLGLDIRDCNPAVFKLWVGTKLALVHSETSEALEGYRKDKPDEHLPHRKSIEVELADALIRICDLAGGLGLDLGGAVVEKLDYNARRADHKPEARAAVGGKAF